MFYLDNVDFLAVWHTHIIGHFSTAIHMHISLSLCQWFVTLQCDS